MQPNIIIQLDQSVEYDREVIERLVGESMGKIDAYLKRFDEKPDAEVKIDLYIKKNSDSSFHGKLQANIDGDIILFDRERFFKLDDLVHHAFQHLKEELSAK